MREYKQLTEEDRIEMYAVKQAGKPQDQIAAVLGVHPSTINRELTRNIELRLMAISIFRRRDTVFFLKYR